MTLARRIARRGPEIVIALAGLVLVAIGVGSVCLRGCQDPQPAHARSADPRPVKLAGEARMVRTGMISVGQTRTGMSGILIFPGLLDSPAAAYRSDGPAVLNDLEVTPGDPGPATAAQLCSKDFHTGDVRNVTESTKLKVCAAYGVDKAHCVGLQPDGSGYEIDHLISLELGGTNDPKNLWPQPYAPRPAAREKDIVENWLHAQVCAGKLDLATAQKEISEDWYQVYLATQGGSGPDPRNRSAP